MANDWKSRIDIFQVQRARALLVFFVFVLCSSQVKAIYELEDIWYTNRAVDHMKQKKMTEAFDEFALLLSEKPFHPLFQYNMGAAFIGVEQYEKAKQMFEELLKLSPLPPVVEFAAYYNLGVLHALEGGDIDQALENYQKALALNPESIEIKTNIELLFKGGKGKGEGEGKDKSDENEEEGEQPKEPQKFTNKPQQPDQFKNPDMSKGDVKKIMEELKKQEQEIRAKHQRKGQKEVDREKSW